jgi:hypothetical protein
VSPALSIVVTGRHDNYGRDFNERFFSALLFNLTALSERGVDCEFILVEWNPMPGRPYLAELLHRAFPVGAGRTLRCLVVDPQYHGAFTQNPDIGYLEYVAKNVGVRRASAPLLLVTNTDVFLGREVVAALADRRIAPGTVYRAARYDVKLGVDQSHLTWEALEDPESQVRRPVLKPPLLAGGTGDFLLADRATFHQLRGFNEVYRAARLGIDLNFVVKAHGAGYPIADIGGPVYHVNHVGSYRISSRPYQASGTQTPWGDLHWNYRSVVYNNSDGWGLREAPARRLTEEITYLEFDRRAVPPLAELRRIVLPARVAPTEASDLSE